MMDVKSILFRGEEISCRGIRDEHGRMIGKKSALYLKGQLDIPFVDKINYGEASGVSAGFNHVYLTHDVDQPFAWLRLKSVVKAIIKNPFNLIGVIKSYFGLVTGVDPYDVFDWMIAQDNKVVSALGNDVVTPVYFVMAQKKYEPHDGHRYLGAPAVKKLLKRLVAAGVEIGLHASYQAGDDTRLIADEKTRLEKAIGRPVKWNRHHYLRAKEPEDMMALSEAGITDDFTLGYADIVGFRVGTCRPYKWIDLPTGKKTNLTIHPLSIMECTLDMRKYMGLSEDEAFSKCKQVIDTVHRYRGDLVLLWHNTSFSKISKSYHRRLYTKVLDYVIEKGDSK